MIALGCAEDDVAVREGAADRLAVILLRSADRSRDGRLSFDEFSEALDCHPQVAAAIEKSGARWLAVSEDAADRLEARPSVVSRLKRALENRRPYAAFLVLWAAANVALFARAWHTYRASNVLDPGGPRLRRLPELQRRAHPAAGDAARPHGRPQDATARARAARRCDRDSRRRGPYDVRARRSSTRPPTWRTSRESPGRPWSTSCRLGAGLTGVVWLAVFVVMWLFARASARAKQKFEVFHASHLLYVAWLVSACSTAPCSGSGWPFRSTAFVDRANRTLRAPIRAHRDRADAGPALGRDSPRSAQARGLRAPGRRLRLPAHPARGRARMAPADDQQRAGARRPSRSTSGRTATGRRPSAASPRRAGRVTRRRRSPLSSTVLTEPRRRTSSSRDAPFSSPAASG